MESGLFAVSNHRCEHVMVAAHYLFSVYLAAKKQ